jgi:hypothetical protein|tara:strand:- start:32 stop:454 length:423 start_codon:yes stop_codon:yes gene_type:complete
MLQRVASLDHVRIYIQKDPVRPHIDAESRLAPGREMYHIDEKAFICLAFLDRIPVSELELLSHNVGNIAVAYTVWSLKKGLGRKIIFETQDCIQDTFRFHRLVTLSPKTEMAVNFHLSNGAVLLQENEYSYNFEYKIEHF